jgi:hypothetical protein
MQKAVEAPRGGLTGPRSCQEESASRRPGSKSGPRRACYLPVLLYRVLQQWILMDLFEISICLPAASVLVPKGLTTKARCTFAIAALLFWP